MVLEAVRDVAAKLQFDVRGDVSINLNIRDRAGLDQPVAKMIGALKEREQKI
jgi:hypothetical protein